MRVVVTIVCLVLAVAGATASYSQQEYWCWDSDEIVIEVDGDEVQIQHLAALYNCCPEPIIYDIQVGDATVFITELTQSPCDCDCCMETRLILTDFPPGPWIIAFRWFDLEVWDWVTDHQQIEVPDVGQEYVPVIEEQTVSDCLFPVGVPEPPEEHPSWGRIKSRYAR